MMKESSPGDLLTVLREATQSLHHQAHEIPFFKALLEQRISREAYIQYLRVQSIVFGALEYHMSRSACPPLENLLSGYTPKLPKLLKDLEFLDHMKISAHEEAVHSALGVAGQIMHSAETCPEALIGYFYTLEGSTRGGVILKKHASRALGLEAAEGFSFLDVYGISTEENWRSFAARLNALSLNPSSVQAIAAAARECFSAILQLYGKLWPLSDSAARGVHVTMLNPEAGNHAVPHDPRELAAAMRAGKRCLEANPYFTARYADRGYRFTMSDSAWLASLCQLEEAAMARQVKWLSDLLSRRGIPRVLMEEHLLFLFESLVREVPERREKYLKLQSAAKVLEAARLKVLTAPVFASLAGEFEKRAGLLETGCLKGAGKIIVGAVTDEKNGIPEAVASLESWLTDDARFSQGWISAVRETLASARMCAA